jgi:plastocyanin
MTTRRFALAALLVAVLAPAALARTAANPTLIGKVGFHNAYRITLTFTNGKPVKSIPAGTYTLIVHDYSKIHNFALGSQTQNRRLFTTGIPWVGTRTYHLTFAPGRYAYACSAHFQTMNGTFVVTPRT